MVGVCVAASERGCWMSVQSKFRNNDGCGSWDSPSPAGLVPRSCTVTLGGTACLFSALFKEPPLPPHFSLTAVRVDRTGGGGFQGKPLSEAEATQILGSCPHPPAPPHCTFHSL